jgi:septation ring formation regulator EzrA
LHKSEVMKLEKKLDEVSENFNVEQSKREISDTEWSRVQKNVEELHQAKEECYTVAMQCSDKLKMLLLVLAHSWLSEILYVEILRV